MIHKYFLSFHVREHVERLRQEATRARLAAEAPREPGVWAAVRSALAERLGRDEAAEADDAA